MESLHTQPGGRGVLSPAPSAPNPPRRASNGGTAVPTYGQRAIRALQKTASLFPGKEGRNRKSREAKERRTHNDGNVQRKRWSRALLLNMDFWLCELSPSGCKSLSLFFFLFKRHNVAKYGMQVRGAFLINPGERASLLPALTPRR